MGSTKSGLAAPAASLRVAARVFWLSLFVVLPGLAAPVLWASAARAETPHCSRPIRVAARPVGRFLWPGPDGQAVGPLRDLLTLIGPRVGCSFVYDPLSTARATDLFGNGEIDILPGAKTPERDAAGRFVLLSNYRLVLLSRIDRHLPVTSVAGLLTSALTIDVVRGYDYGLAYQALVDRMAASGRVIENVSLETLAERMATGRSDAALMTAPPFVDVALAAGLKDALQVTPVDGLPPIVGGLYLVVRALGPADSDLLEHAISDGVARGEFTEFLRRSVAGVPWGMTGVLTDGEAVR